MLVREVIQVLTWNCMLVREVTEVLTWNCMLVRVMNRRKSWQAELMEECLDAAPDKASMQRSVRSLNSEMVSTVTGTIVFEILHSVIQLIIR